VDGRIWNGSYSLLHAGSQDGKTSYLKTPRKSLLFPHPAAHPTGSDDIAPCLDADNTCFELVQHTPFFPQTQTVACLRTEISARGPQPDASLVFWYVIFLSLIANNWGTRWCSG
jgi:hypothetical protein